MIRLDCDTFTSKSVAYVLSSEAVNWFNGNNILTIWADDDTTPSGKTAFTLLVITFTIDCENVVSNDCDRIVVTDELKSSPICADVAKLEPLSICFNLIRFALL